MSDLRPHPLYHVVIDGYPWPILHTAFELITDGCDWKKSIDSQVPPAMQPILAVAVPFFTGSVPKFTPLANGKVRCQADGYYIATGS